MALTSDSADFNHSMAASFPIPHDPFLLNFPGKGSAFLEEQFAHFLRMDD